MVFNDNQLLEVYTYILVSVVTPYHLQHPFIASLSSTLKLYSLVEYIPMDTVLFTQNIRHVERV